jgi:hypothetical protein
MVKLVRVMKSPRTGKKWRAVFDDDTHTDFGDSSMKDYTQHHDTERRTNYRSRHRRDLATADPRRAGYLSYYILWGDNTNINDNIADYRRRFNM